MACIKKCDGHTDNPKAIMPPTFFKAWGINILPIENIRIFNGCEFRHKGNCLASQGLPSDDEQLSPATKFSICTEQPLCTVIFLSFRTDRSGQTVQTQIRLLLEEQSDLGLHCLPFLLHRLDTLLYGRAT